MMRIELKNINPPEEIRLTMEKQMTAGDAPAVVTTAEGAKPSHLRARSQAVADCERRPTNRDSGCREPGRARLRVAQAKARAIQMVAQAIGTRQPGADRSRSHPSR
jgi:regulator of protease activity HflC (stomatin/prohibitin superfamily)